MAFRLPAAWRTPALRRPCLLCCLATLVAAHAHGNLMPPCLHPPCLHPPTDPSMRVCVRNRCSRWTARSGGWRQQLLACLAPWVPSRPVPRPPTRRRVHGRERRPRCTATTRAHPFRNIIHTCKARINQRIAFCACLHPPMPPSTHCPSSWHALFSRLPPSALPPRCPLHRCLPRMSAPPPPPPPSP